MQIETFKFNQGHKHYNESAMDVIMQTLKLKTSLQLPKRRPMLKLLPLPETHKLSPELIFAHWKMLDMIF